MGKCNETKAVILGLLDARPKTMTELSKELGLARSTVSQHLRDLVYIGAIKRVENVHIRKWKYYQKISDMTRSSVQGNAMVYEIRAPYIAIKGQNYSRAF